MTASLGLGLASPASGPLNTARQPTLRELLGLLTKVPREVASLAMDASIVQIVCRS